jgi:hypothetical protein
MFSSSRKRRGADAFENDPSFSSKGTVLNLEEVLNVLYGTGYSDYAKIWSAPPLFLEDENIFQKSATMVVILLQFRLQPSWPIFELHL